MANASVCRRRERERRAVAATYQEDAFTKLGNAVVCCIQGRPLNRIVGLRTAVEFANSVQEQVQSFVFPRVDEPANILEEKYPGSEIAKNS